MSPPSVTERLSHQLARPVDDASRARARLYLLDWIACVAGARRETASEVARVAEPDALTRAALAGNLLEMDDVHRAARLHPGPVVWPAALSAVRDEGAGMDALLDAGVRGYEAAIAVGATFDDHHYAHWHPTSTAGGFGAAAAAASVYGLDEERTVGALGTVGSLAGGLWRMRHEPVITKAVHVAHAALAGLWAARLARAGGVGPKRILEGEQGLYAAMTHAPGPLILGEGWRMAEVSFKPWAACRHAHPAIDAALMLRADGRFTFPVRIETYADAIRFCDRPAPATATEARFSLQHAVAAVHAHGWPKPEHFEPDAIARLADARAGVEVIEASDLTARYPAHFGARVTTERGTVALEDALGDPERPLDREGLERKVDELFAWGGVVPALAERCKKLALEGEDAAALIDALEVLV